MKMEDIHNYYVYPSDNKFKIKYYESLQELLENAKTQVEEISSSYYIGIGAEYATQDQHGIGANDFICRVEGDANFRFCNDIEQLNIDVPVEFKEVLDKLIEIL